MTSSLALLDPSARLVVAFLTVNDIEANTFGATYTTTLRSISHTLYHATTPQTAAPINTLQHHFEEHVRTTLYNLRTYALHQQELLHSAYPPVINFPLPPSPFILHPNTGLPYDTPVIPTATAYPMHSLEPLDISQFHISSPLRVPARSIPPSPTTPQGRFRFYAVRRGRQTGIFTSWPECRRHVNGISSEYRGFQGLEDAQAYLRL
jgi:hypothetical protein